MIHTEKLPGRKRNRPLKDYAGEKFGRLTALELVERKERSDSNVWRFRCECGGEYIGRIKSVRGGHTSSCGCLHREGVRKRNTTHGLSGTRTYRIWKNMRRRCLSETCTDFASYGGRGISICPAWSEYAAFLADMGECPEGMSLDRIDVNGNYEPGNCRWADATTQASNKRTARLVEAFGETHTMSEWARRLGVSHKLIDYRLKAGWPPERAVSQKPGGGR